MSRPSAEQGGGMLAVVPVRDGVLPLAGDEAIAEAGGRALLVGDGCAAASALLAGIATSVVEIELPGYGPRRAVAELASEVGRDTIGTASVVLPASPDGRDLAPLLAHALGRALLAGASEVHATGARLIRQGGLVMEDVVIGEPFVATLQPGVRGALPDPSLPAPSVETLVAGPREAGDPAVVEITPPDPATMDLSEAPRIVGGGAGLGSPDAMARLGAVAEALGCSLGATRVVTDWGWAPFERQIGTTGVAVHPELYLAFGISGAVQHTAGLGDPTHIIAVNTDAACPMMNLADLAIVTDAPALVDALLARLGAPDAPA